MRENAPDQKAIYSGRCGPLILSYLMNTGEIIPAGTLGWRVSSPMLTDTNGPSGNCGTGYQSHRENLQQSWAPNSHCQTSAWLWQARTRRPCSPTAERGAAEGSELEALMHHPKRRARAPVNICNSEPKCQESNLALTSIE